MGKPTPRSSSPKCSGTGSCGSRCGRLRPRTRKYSVIEIDGHSLDLNMQTHNEVFATLVYQPRSHKFHAARKALQALGGSYSPELRAWRLTVNQDTIRPLQRLYARTSMALWVVEDGEFPQAEMFERYE